MGRRMERNHAVRGKVAAIGIGALLAAASVVPATAAQAASTTTVHGTVQAGATKLSGVPVGFWSRTGHTLVTTKTGASGAFTLRVPSGVRGFAYAGVRPDSTKAVFTVAGKAFVRGVIGAGQGATTSFPIYQGHASATAANLAGGRALHFTLQKPGRIRVLGGSYFRGNGQPILGVVEVQRLNGSTVQRTVADRTTGTARSKLLVPGSYRAHLIPQVPYLPRTVSVTVRAGATRSLSPTFTRGATLSGLLTGPGKAPAVGVRVTVPQGTGRWSTDVTDSKGRYSIPGLAAGKHSLRIGYALPRDPEADLPPVVPPPTSDDYLPVVVPFTVDAAHHAVHEDVALQEAGHVVGTVTGSTAVAGQEVRVWLENANHRVIRTAEVTGGRYELGGLRPGTQYTVYVLDPADAQHDGRYGSASFSAAPGTLTRDLAIDTRTLTLSGTAVPEGRVRVRTLGSVLPDIDRESDSLDSTGHYAIHGLIPGAYEVIAFAGDRTSRPTAVTLLASTTKNLTAGPKPGTYRVRFVSGSAPIWHVDAEARDRAGDVATISTRSLTSTNRTGRAVAGDLRPGTYRYSPSSFVHGADDANAPVVDGPWWFGAISSTFTIRAGRTTDDGTIALHVHAR